MIDRRTTIRARRLAHLLTVEGCAQRLIIALDEGRSGETQIRLLREAFEAKDGA
jgi:hypothetical protein